jgi:hypothetical protein
MYVFFSEQKRMNMGLGIAVLVTYQVTWISNSRKVVSQCTVNCKNSDMKELHIHILPLSF